ncbi:FAD-dependent oxidoreductase [Geitlerinema sp. P-1104]|uniref:FAD-dependent oxidoreductase n=1 Tax=Geitlerinema sp. P-1104 TaxID=2546230 RepID=UPI001476D316|nr:FAD-dependent oxidoreductase [Geitlerinema sp. P-1104]NMG59612.1 FAD-dependent oxidoreductase [Geitlerinema sp. P-1104]
MSIARDRHSVDVLVVGGGTGGTAAAIQAARQGVKTLLVSEFPWLGGMLTAGGVSAPDGNELLALQTGLWGQFLRELQQRQPGGLDWGWVSFFTFNPAVGAQIFQDWLEALPNLHWIWGETPQGVRVENNRLREVAFQDFDVTAEVILDGTELGDLLALADIPHRWGWEWRSQFNEPSAPETPNSQTAQYPVQAMTWVGVLQDYGEGAVAPEIPAPAIDVPSDFLGAWDNYGVEKFLNYGRLPGDRFMLNWPQHGNDYGVHLQRLIESPQARHDCLQEAQWRTQSFARFLQRRLGRRYGLAEGLFPQENSGLALHPYFRESRRLVGVKTVCERDILPQLGGQVAPLPLGEQGVEAIAIGNYANDHHYPNWDCPVQPKSLRWGGRWTGTPFALPYGCLIPLEMDGVLACEKNISVSHIANGCTRLQPLVMNLGQAAGLAAALCVQRHCQPRELPVRVLQEALLRDKQAPAAVIPLFNALLEDPDWQHWQRYYLSHPEEYPATGYHPGGTTVMRRPLNAELISGRFKLVGPQAYQLEVGDRLWSLVTLHPTVERHLQSYPQGQPLSGWGQINPSGQWLRLEGLLS